MQADMLELNAAMLRANRALAMFKVLAQLEAGEQEWPVVELLAPGESRGEVYKLQLDLTTIMAEMPPGRIEAALAPRREKLTEEFVECLTKANQLTAKILSLWKTRTEDSSIQATAIGSSGT